MPLAPNPVMAMPTSKPKIGFSIESIVGENSKEAGLVENEKQEKLHLPLVSEYIKTNEHFSDIKLAPNHVQKALRLRPCSPEKAKDNYISFHQPSSPKNFNVSKSMYGDNQENIQTRTDIVNRTPSPHMSAICSRSSPEFNCSSILTGPKVPLVIPSMSAGYMVPFSRHEFKPIPSYSTDITPQHNSQLLAAQITAAALSGQPFSQMHQQNNHLHSSSMARDSYPLYPWLISRHGRIFPHRFPGSKYI